MTMILTVTVMVVTMAAMVMVMVIIKVMVKRTSANNTMTTGLKHDSSGVPLA